MKGTPIHVSFHLSTHLQNRDPVCPHIPDNRNANRARRRGEWNMLTVRQKPHIGDPSREPLHDDLVAGSVQYKNVDGIGSRRCAVLQFTLYGGLGTAIDYCGGLCPPTERKST